MLNLKNYVCNMETMLETLEKSFDFLNPYEKAKFIDARLAWATSGALCTEMNIRLCHPQNNYDNAERSEETTAADESR